jgi:hypothetical protein
MIKKERSLVSKNSNSLNSMIKRSSLNRTQKTLSLAVATFAIVGMIGVLNNTQVFADPAPTGYQKVYQFNMIDRPNDYTGGCGDGNRLFVNHEDDKHAHVDIINSNFWDVTDCNATGGHHGEITFDGTGTYLVGVKMVGKPDTSFRICTTNDRLPVGDDPAHDDTESIDEHDCILDVVIVREKGKPKIKIDLQALFDPALTNEIWSVESNGQAKAQFIVYKLIEA